MAQRTCSIDDCGKPAKCRGWCDMHYWRWSKYGDPLRVKKTAEERFWSKVDKNGPEGCWLWTDHLGRQGYADFWVPPRPVKAHRFAYELLVGPIPEGLVIDHLCSVRHCVNPAHLEAVTQRVNVLRSTNHVAAQAVATHCKRGHEFTPENTYMHRGKRDCRTCHRDQARRARRDEA